MRKARSANARNERGLIASCPLAAVMALVGGRWKILILYYVAHGLTRYGQLRRTIGTISGKMLYQQLRELEADGLLLRVVEGRVVSYRPTSLGASLVAQLRELERWSQAHDIATQLLARRTSGAPDLPR
jgi:DNA-binding HxlR family transcriptional regulator